MQFSEVMQGAKSIGYLPFTDSLIDIFTGLYVAEIEGGILSNTCILVMFHLLAYRCVTCTILTTLADGCLIAFAQ